MWWRKYADHLHLKSKIIGGNEERGHVLIGQPLFSFPDVKEGIPFLKFPIKVKQPVIKIVIKENSDAFNGMVFHEQIVVDF